MENAAEATVKGFAGLGEQRVQVDEANPAATGREVADEQRHAEDRTGPRNPRPY